MLSVPILVLSSRFIEDVYELRALEHEIRGTPSSLWLYAVPRLLQAGDWWTRQIPGEKDARPFKHEPILCYLFQKSRHEKRTAA
jgi:hypothetical protein